MAKKKQETPVSEQPEIVTVPKEQTPVVEQPEIVTTPEEQITEAASKLSSKLLNLCSAINNSSSKIKSEIHKRIISTEEGLLAKSRTKGVFCFHNYNSQPIPILPFILSDARQAIEMINSISAVDATNLCNYLHNTTSGMQVLNLTKGIF